MTSSSLLDVSLIRTDGGTQPRAEIDDVTVDEYAEALLAGAEFPPVTVYYDGEAYWLADGFHRLLAHKRISRKQIFSDVRPGTRRDAVLHACGANAAHGLRRSNEDKRRVVLLLLADSEWGKWSDREIAKRCEVSYRYVGTIRSSLGTKPSEPRTYQTKHGTEAVMNTAKIAQANTERTRTVPVETSAASTNPTAPEPTTPQAARIETGGSPVDIQDAADDDERYTALADDAPTAPAFTSAVQGDRIDVLSGRSEFEALQRAYDELAKETSKVSETLEVCRTDLARAEAALAVHEAQHEASMSKIHQLTEALEDAREVCEKAVLYTLTGVARSRAKEILSHVEGAICKRAPGPRAIESTQAVKTMMAAPGKTGVPTRVIIAPQPGDESGRKLAYFLSPSAPMPQSFEDLLKHTSRTLTEDVFRRMNTSGQYSVTEIEYDPA